MKKTNNFTKLLYVLIAAVMLFCIVTVCMTADAATAAQPVAIDETSFPDANFRNFVSRKYDLNTDAVLDETELSAVTSMDVQSKEISSLKGIEYFTCLTSLTCSYNPLTELDVSACRDLTYLNCSSASYPKLKALNVRGCTALTELNCSNNALTALDISGNTMLERLDCSYNDLKQLELTGRALKYVNCSRNDFIMTALSPKCPNLEVLHCAYTNVEALYLWEAPNLKELVCEGSSNIYSLDVSDCTKLETLICGYPRSAFYSLDVSGCTSLKTIHCEYASRMRGLDVSDCTALEYLNFTNTPIQSIDLSKNTELRELYCYEANLTELDVSSCTKLENLECFSNQITALDLSNNSNLKSVKCQNNQLTELKLSEAPYEAGDTLSFSCSNNRLTKLDSVRYLTGDYGYSGIGGQNSSAEVLKTVNGWALDFSKLVDAENIGKVELAENQSDWSYNAETGMAVYSGETAPTELKYYYHGKNGYTPYDQTESFFEKSFDVTLTLTEAESPLKISGAYLTLEDNIKINYLVKKEIFDGTGFENPYILFNLNGVERKVSNYTETADGYVFSFADIAPNQMNDILEATLCANKDGETFASETTQYSVAQYCSNTLSKYSGDENAELRTLIVDLVNYGTKSQLFTSYNTENLVSDILTEEQAAWGTSEEPTLESVLDREYATVENPAAVWKGAGLNLTNTIEMRFVFEADDVTGLEVRIETAGGTTVIPSSKFVADGGRYYVTFKGLNAGQLSEHVYAAVYKDGAAVSNTVRYSVESYAASKQNDSDPKLAELVKAMMKYGNAANAYTD